MILVEQWHAVRVEADPHDEAREERGALRGQRRLSVRLVEEVGCVQYGPWRRQGLLGRK